MGPSAMRIASWAPPSPSRRLSVLALDLRWDDERDGASRLAQDLAHLGSEEQPFVRGSKQHAHHEEVDILALCARKDDVFGAAAGIDPRVHAGAELASEAAYLLDEFDSLGAEVVCAGSQGGDEVGGDFADVERGNPGPEFARIVHRQVRSQSRERGAGDWDQQAAKRRFGAPLADDYDRGAGDADDAA